jgi:hypothetical protein
MKLESVDDGDQLIEQLRGDTKPNGNVVTTGDTGPLMVEYFLTGNVTEFEAKNRWSFRSMRFVRH